MSPASRSKPKDKKASKEPQKASSNPCGSTAAGGAVAASAYNPLSGTFHTLETVPSSCASPLHNNGRFRNIDESDEHSGASLGAGVEYDSISNNGSWSGESEDHKEKVSNPPVRQETIPGAANDKREKIRQKNERKHQRQKERRAQELLERCNGYLMSRKLETLAEQLVSMGFLRERATLALMMNEGKLEQSVAWLFEAGEEADKNTELVVGQGNLKIDISEELARIADLEIRYKCTKQEVERAVVAAEGDLEKAAEALKSSKRDPPCARPKPEELGDPLTVNNGKLSVAATQNMVSRSQPRPIPTLVQTRRDERDFNHTKASIALVGSSESGNKSLQPMKRIPPKVDWGKHQQLAMPSERKWLNAGGSQPSVSSLSSPLQASPPPARTEAQYMAGSDLKNLQPLIREPVIMMQRSQSVHAKQAPATRASTSPPGSAGGWYPTSSSMEIMKSNGFMHPMTRSLSPNSLNSGHMYQNQLHNQQQQHFTNGNVLGDPLVTSGANGLWSRTGASSSSLAAASSLGLFSALGSSSSSGAASPIDWGSGSMAQFDYTSIDWSLDRGLAPPRSGGLWFGPSSSLQKHPHI